MNTIKSIATGAAAALGILLALAVVLPVAAWLTQYVASLLPRIGA